MTPQTSVQTPETRTNRRRVTVAGALLVAATLVGTAAFMALPDPTDAVGREGLSQDQSRATPEAVLAEAHRVLPVLAAGDAAVATQAASDAQATLDAAARDAQATLLDQAAAHQSTVDDAVRDTGALPGVPRGWVPGTDVTHFVGPVGSAPYAVPQIHVPTGVGGTTALAEQTVGGTFATGSGAPGTGVSEIDAMTGQLGLLDGAYDTLAGTDLGTTLGGLGVPALPGGVGDGLLPGTPKPGQASGTVDPDDEGAQNALAFGYQVTDGVTGAFGGLDAQANSVLASHAGLLTKVEALAAQARALEAEGAAGIDAQLQQRLTEAEATTQARLDALAAAQEAYVAAIEAAQADAQAALDAQVASARADVEATAQEQAQALADAAADALADAEARSAAVDVQAQEYLALLAQMQADGKDVTAEVAAVQAEAERLRAGIQADAEAQQAGLLGAAEDLQAQAEAHLAGIQDARAALPDAQDRVDEAVAASEKALAFGEAVALARHAAVGQTHAEAAMQATADLHARADAQVESVRASAQQYLAGSEAFASSGTALVEKVQADGDAHVDLAAGYVRKVAEDYASVPEPERQAAAEALLAEAETLSTVGLGVVASGDQVAQQFAAVAQSSAALRDQVALMPL